jgi:cyanophycin synthetase
MEFIDARRLTGPSLLFDAPGSILDVACDAKEAARLAPAWEKHVRRMLSALGWEDNEFATLTLTGGVSLGFTAPIDSLYAASEINEWAYAACDAELNNSPLPDFDKALAGIRNAVAEESNDGLMRLVDLAQSHGVTLLWDDDFVSLGHGRYSETWPVRELPDSGSLDWSAFRDVPCGLITGTNGKTTTVRTAAHIARTAGHSVGMSSTDFIAVNDRIVDRDDWSGPGGARNVLREKEVDFAILETARGGLLRRGLGVERADAALITNIAEDHLGDFGSRNLDELLNCKWIVSRAVRETGRLVLNADDQRLADKARDYDGELVWFSLDAENPVIAAHAAEGGTAFVLHGEELLRVVGPVREPICCARDIPMTMQGAALHNVANALAAAAFCHCLGLEIDDLRAGLVTMSQDKNPGRCNVYEIDGYTVLVDFAHNPDALHALLDMANRMPFERKALCFGQAGDRPDDLIRKLARSAWRSGLDRVFVSELTKYHRGREAGDVYAIIRDELITNGARPDQVEHHIEEIDSLEAAMRWAQPGDLIVMLALERSESLYEKLRSRSGT